MSSSKNFCFIPAKLGSTRLKKKNILPLNGKELIYYPINNALSSGLFSSDDVILSTESEIIKKVGLKYGANVPYLRDEKLARDPYGVVDVVLDFIERFPKYKAYDNLCLLLPTAPLAIVEDVVDAYKNYSSQGKGVVMSVVPNEHSALRAVYVKEGQVAPVFNEYIHKKSQELEATYRINGAVIWISVADLMREKSYFIQPWGAYIMPAARSVDIDDEMGYKFAQLLTGD